MMHTLPIFALCLFLALSLSLTPCDARDSSIGVLHPNEDVSDHSASSVVGSVELGLRYFPTFTAFEISSPNNGIINAEFTVSNGFGAILAYYYTDQSAIEAEFIYNSLSKKYSYQNGENTIELKYINVPILYSFNTGKLDPVNFNVVIGPQIGLKVGSSMTLNQTENGSNTFKGILAVKNGDLGFAYGAGVDFGNASWRMSAGFRGVYGLLDISDNSRSVTTDEFYILDRSHVKTYSIYLGVSLIL